MISVSFWAPPKTKSNERPFSNQLCQRRRRPLQIISRNAQTTSQKEEGAAAAFSSSDVRCKNAEKYDDATTRGGKRTVTHAQSPRAVSPR